MSGSGHRASSTLTVFAIPRATTRGGSLTMHAHEQSIYLGSVTVNPGGEESSSIPIPASVSIGRYVLQVNGLNEQSQVRSVKLLLDVIAAPPSVRAGKVRAAAFYEGKSAALTDSGKSKLRTMVKSIPAGARNATITIVGVSVSMETRSANIALARERAEVVADYLVASGVKGSYRITISTNYEVRSSTGAVDKLSGAEKPGTTASGKPLTTATIGYVQVS